MLMLAIDCTNAKLETIIRLLKLVLQIVQLVIPIGLIVLGSLDFAKGVFAQDESAIKKNQMLFVKRLIAAVLVFFTSLIVRIVMGFIGNDAWQACWDNTSTVKSITCNYSYTSGTKEETLVIKYSENDRKNYTMENKTADCGTVKKISGWDSTTGCPEYLYQVVSGDPTRKQCYIQTTNTGGALKRFKLGE